MKRNKIKREKLKKKYKETLFYKKVNKPSLILPILVDECTDKMFVVDYKKSYLAFSDLYGKEEKTLNELSELIKIRKKGKWRKRQSLKTLKKG